MDGIVKGHDLNPKVIVPKHSQCVNIFISCREKKNTNTCTLYFLTDQMLDILNNHLRRFEYFAKKILNYVIAQASILEIS